MPHQQNRQRYIEVVEYFSPKKGNRAIEVGLQADISKNTTINTSSLDAGDRKETTKSVQMRKRAKPTGYKSVKVTALHNIHNLGCLVDQREVEFRRTMMEIVNGYPMVEKQKLLLKKER